MLRLVETYFASAGKPDVSDRSPPCFLNVRPAGALLRERRHLGFQIVTHQVEFRGAVLFGGMNRRFRWRQRENQPPVAGVYGGKSEDVPEEGAISRRILAVHDHVGAKDHALLLRQRRTSREACPT